MTPSAAPIRIARFAAFCGKSITHCWRVPSCIGSGSQLVSTLPMGTRPSMTMSAATASMPASTVRMRKARNAAEAMKNARSANIVAVIGEYRLS
jgi:hypothetical protein